MNYLALLKIFFSKCRRELLRIIYGFRRVRFNKCRTRTRMEFIDSSHIDGFCSSGLLLSFHSSLPPFLPSFCSLFSSRSVDRFFCFAASSSTSSSSCSSHPREKSREIRRIKNHECISQTGFPKSEPINGVDDLTRFEFHLNNAQIKPHVTTLERRGDRRYTMR